MKLARTEQCKSHFVKCDCGCQQMEVERFDYSYPTKTGTIVKDEGFNFTIWCRGRDGKRIYGWREKFRWCWNILKTGKPWADDIIVTNKRARGIAKFIIQNLPKEESK